MPNAMHRLHLISTDGAICRARLAFAEWLAMLMGIMATRGRLEAPAIDRDSQVIARGRIVCDRGVGSESQTPQKEHRGGIDITVFATTHRAGSGNVGGFHTRTAEGNVIVILWVEHVDARLRHDRPRREGVV